MTVRDYRRRRWPAWLAAAAALLLAFAPPLSQVLAADATTARHGATAEHHRHHAATASGEAVSGFGEDCFRKCGYCDFLAHAPLLESGVPAWPAIAPTHGGPCAPLIRDPAARARFRVAQPRGPPATV